MTAAAVVSAGMTLAVLMVVVTGRIGVLSKCLREESRNLDSDEIARLQDAVNDSWAVLNLIRRGGSFSKETELDTGIYVDSLIPKKYLIPQNQVKAPKKQGPAPKKQVKAPKKQRQAPKNKGR